MKAIDYILLALCFVLVFVVGAGSGIEAYKRKLANPEQQCIDCEVKCHE